MNDLTTVSNDVHNFMFGLQAVRVVMVDGEPWFVTRDLCAILGIAKAESAMRGLEPSERGAHTMSTPGGPQKLNTCNESGMYALIFNSRKPQARTFRHWVTNEVLPSIRKTGQYVAPVLVAPVAKPVPLATPVGDLALVETYARLCNVSQSSCVALLRKVAENHGLDTGLLPGYVVDSPSGSGGVSSEATAALTDLLKARGLGISAHDFNLLLEQAGYLQRRTRKTRSKRYAEKGGVKTYWCITPAGLAYGKNLTAPESPRETVPHWFVSRFDELRARLRPLYRQSLFH